MKKKRKSRNISVVRRLMLLKFNSDKRDHGAKGVQKSSLFIERANIKKTKIENNEPQQLVSIKIATWFELGTWHPAAIRFLFEFLNILYSVLPVKPLININMRNERSLFVIHGLSYIFHSCE